MANESKPRQASWFQHTNPTSLIINRSPNMKTKIAEIKDQNFIQRMGQAISSLPVDADEKLKSFAEDVDVWALQFCNNDKKCDEIQFYRGRIQTPRGGFYTKHSETEKQLAQDIESILSPKLGTPLPLVENLPYELGDFSIEFTGTEKSPPSPVTVSFTDYNFKVHPKKGEPFKIKFTTGQRSAQPVAFKVGSKTFTLLGHELEKGIRLYPNYFAVVK